MKISTEQKRFVEEGAKLLREDGRLPFDLRHINIDTNIIPAAQGSSQLTHSFSSTRITCFIQTDVKKCITGSPYFHFVNLNLSLDDSRLLHKSEKTLLARKESFLHHMFLKTLRNLFTKDLCELVKGEIYKTVSINISVFSSDGNPTDLISLALFSALSTTVCPKISTFFKEKEKQYDFLVSENQGKQEPLFSDTTSLFLSSTLHQVADEYFLDISKEESFSCKNSLSVFVDANGQIIGIYFQNNGTVKLKRLQNLISRGRKISLELFEAVKSDKRDGKN
eukprot:snap_masked-scaffold_9-processed-gene-9.27-mRNA-1 protein AED:1.00 eAED:1.00 QI:0/-1/0/0/-1/1/1/0/279